MRLSAAFARLAVAAAVLAAVLIPAVASTTVFPAVGGRGDVAGELRCPRAHYLVGLRGRAGNWIDQLTLICRRIDPPAYTGGPPVTSRAVGGNGGTPVEAYCPLGSAIRGFAMVMERDDGVDQAPMAMIFRCQRPVDGRMTGDFAIHGRMGGDASANLDSYSEPFSSNHVATYLHRCPGNEYAVGLNVRHGQHVNAAGLICEDLSDPGNTEPPIGMIFVPTFKEPIGRGMEDDTNRVGSDYRRFELGQPDPAACQRACRDDSSRCNAWTYVRPGQQGPKAICYLKREAPPPSRHPCCISGENRVILVMPPLGPTPPSSTAPPPSPPSPPQSSSASSGAFEDNTDRPGLDIARIELNTPDPLRCQRRCDERGQCRAWTYVRPGVQGPRAVCYLKSAAPPPKPNNCCVSGVK